MCCRKPGVEVDGTAKARLCLLQRAHLLQGVAEVGVTARGALVVRDRLPQRRHRILGSAGLQQRETELRLRRPVIGSDRQRFLEPLDRVCWAAGGAQRVAEIVADVGVALVESDGTTVVRLGLVETAQSVEDVGEIVEEAGIARRPARGLRQQRQRFLERTSLGMEHAEEV